MLLVCGGWDRRMKKRFTKIRRTDGQFVKTQQISIILFRETVMFSFWRQRFWLDIISVSALVLFLFIRLHLVLKFPILVNCRGSRSYQIWEDIICIVARSSLCARFADQVYRKSQGIFQHRQGTRKWWCWFVMFLWISTAVSIAEGIIQIGVNCPSNLETLQPAKHPKW